MSNAMRPIVLALILGVAFACSNCSTSPNPDALAELQKMCSAVQDMSIVVSAGVTKDQYSQRLTDALLKFGNGDGKCKGPIAKFAKRDQRAQAGEICQHLTEAMDAYKYAKDYFGDAYDPNFPDMRISNLKEGAYAEAKKRFSTLDELPVSQTSKSGYKSYTRDAMLQALWKVAEQDAQAAKDILEKLSLA